MINPSESIIWIVNFLTKPTWHLVALYVFLLLIVAWTRYDNWIAKGKS